MWESVCGRKIVCKEIEIEMEMEIEREMEIARLCIFGFGL